MLAAVLDWMVHLERSVEEAASDKRCPGQSMPVVCGLLLGLGLLNSIPWLHADCSIVSLTWESYSVAFLMSRNY